MNTKLSKVSLLTAAVLLACAGHANADTASWTSWANNTGTFTQNGNLISVQYSGEYQWVDYSASIFNDVPNSFTNSQVTNTPGSNGTLAMYGGDTQIKTFHFSQAVIDPLIAIWSVGQGGVPVSFNFQTSNFTILSQGAGHWGGGTLVQSGSSVTGLEGNGLLQFKGSYTDIAFITPNFENYYGATVGAIAAVPEPETYAMLLSGLGLLGFIARRRMKV